MGLDACFEIELVLRDRFISDNVVAHLPEAERTEARRRAMAIVSNFVGTDRDALSILGYAAERGRFDEFAGKLEEHYGSSLSYVHPDARRLAVIPGAVRAAQFFLRCYEEMGIQPVQSQKTATA